MAYEYSSAGFNDAGDDFTAQAWDANKRADAIQATDPEGAKLLRSQAQTYFEEADAWREANPKVGGKIQVDTILPPRPAFVNALLEKIKNKKTVLIIAILIAVVGLVVLSRHR